MPRNLRINLTKAAPHLRLHLTAMAQSIMVRCVLLVMLFVCLVLLVPDDPLILLLNGVFCGTIVTVCISYRRLICNALCAKHPMDNVRQMVLGFALLWVAILIAVGQSLIASHHGFNPFNTTAQALMRYLAILAAILQVSAPDYGLSWRQSHEKRLLWLSILCGCLIALGVIALQVLFQ